MICITVFEISMDKIIHLGNATFEVVQNRKIRNTLNLKAPIHDLMPNNYIFAFMRNSLF